MFKQPLKTISVTGKDAATFLQNFITCNVDTLQNTPLLAAACNQKGRMIANFWMWREMDTFYLQLPQSMSATLLAHFEKYRFRSEVNFDIVDKTAPNEPNFTIIWVVPETSETLIPQMISMEKHGGVSFNKGCYLGQEIIARTEHLGKLKRHLYSFTLGKAVAANINDDITDKDGHKMGVIVAIDQQTIFAVIEDRAAQAALYWKSHLLQQVRVC